MDKVLFRMKQWNCRGANLKLIDIITMLQTFLPICFFLNETNFYQLSLFQIPLYVVFRQDREKDANDLLYNGPCGGAAILVKEGTSVLRENRHTYSGDKLSEWISLDVIPESRTAAIRVITGYCPPSSCLETKWLEKQFEEANRLQMPCFFAGDVNARSPLWGRELWNLHGHAINNMATRLGLQVVTSPPTRLQINTGSMSTIDIWIVNDLARSFVSGNVKIGDRITSDHFSTFVDCHMPTIGYVPPPPTVEETALHNIEKANRSAFYKTLRLLLENVKVPEVGEPVANLIRYRDEIINCIKAAIKAHVPLCPKSELSSVIMSEEMRDILAQKRIVERHFRNNGAALRHFLQQQALALLPVLLCLLCSNAGCQDVIQTPHAD